MSLVAPFHITGADIRQECTRDGGRTFTELVNDLIYAEAHCLGQPDSIIITNSCINAPDGGVDTLVSQGWESDRTGYFGSPSVWQFKATSFRDALRRVDKEVKKPSVRKYLAKGYAYRMCVAGSATPEQVSEARHKLEASINQLHPGAESPHILSADALAAWAKQYPAIVTRFFRPSFMSSHSFDVWTKSVRSITPEFVSTSQYAQFRDLILRHVAFTTTPVNVVLTIKGTAGCGKTRTVHEALAQVHGVQAIVIYTYGDQTTIDIATYLSNNRDMSAVLVVDECSSSTSFRLKETLQGHIERVRVIAINNEVMPCTSPEQCLCMKPYSTPECESILARNFPRLAPSIRRAAAELSGGKVRLAADLCRECSFAQAVGAPCSIDDYFQHRLTDDDQKTIEALSLVSRLGFRGDVEHELAELCAFTCLREQDVREAIVRLKESVGFIASGARFLYATPEIIARTAFARAWRRWASVDESKFLKGFPRALVARLLDRVKESGDNVTRHAVADYWRGYVTSLSPSDLSDRLKVDRLVSLVQMSPEKFYPILRSLVERANVDQLRNVSDNPSTGSRSPRRCLVHLAAELAQFGEHFKDSEVILLRLALAENELDISNNATGQWLQLFRIAGSGTPKPFLERLQILRTRLLDSDGHVGALGLQALEHLLQVRHCRWIGPPVFGGKVTPDEWMPKDLDELRECQRMAVDVLCMMADVPSHEAAVRHIVITSLRDLLRLGYLDMVRKMLIGDRLSTDECIQARAKVEEYLQFDTRDDSSGQRNPSYRREVQDWYEYLRPTGIHGDVVTAVGPVPWHAQMVGTEAQWRDLITDVAKRLVSTGGAMESELSWLSSGEARSAWFLGVEVGRLDHECDFLDVVVKAASNGSDCEFAAGYVRGHVESGADTRSLADMLDRMEPIHPEIAFVLAYHAGSVVNPVARALRMVDGGYLHASRLKDYWNGVDGKPLTMEEWTAILHRLVSSAKNGDREALRAALHLAPRCARNGEATRELATSAPELADLLWCTLELTASALDGLDGYWWSEVLKWLASSDPARTARIATVALTHLSSYSQEPERILEFLAEEHPKAVIAALDEAMQDPTRSSFVRVLNLSSIIRRLPVPLVSAWLDQRGVDCVRQIARHLETPYIAYDGTPVVPELTALVLERYGEDDEMFHRFLCGRHALHVYSGDIASEFDREAAAAERFSSHGLRRVREWAEHEIVSRRRSAQAYREWKELEEGM